MDGRSREREERLRMIRPRVQRINTGKKREEAGLSFFLLQFENKLIVGGK